MDCPHSLLESLLKLSKVNRAGKKKSGATAPFEVVYQIYT